MAARVCVAVEAAAPMVGSASKRAVNVETPVAGGAAEASVAADVAEPASGGVGAGVSSSSSFCCPLVFQESVETISW